MLKIIKKYRTLSFEDKTIFSTTFSILFNAVMAVGKIFLSFFFGIFFLVSGVLNIFMMMSKSECYLGVKFPNKKTFEYRNFMTGLFLILAGLQYAIYMGRMLYTNVELMEYDMILGISIATVSFVEIAIAIIGCFKVNGKGHYYRNIKIINLCSAMTAIVLTEVALMSFASETDSRMLDGIFGLVVGAIIVLMGVFIFVAHKISIVDREHNIYKIQNLETFYMSEVSIRLTNSKFYADYMYVGKRVDDKIDGHIIRLKSPILKWNVYINILVVVLSEILIFPYAVGAFIFYVKNRKLIDILDKKMAELSCYKIKEE